MHRLSLTPRPDWRDRLAALGVDPQVTTISPYWREDAAYELSLPEVEALHAAVGELHRIIIAATEHVIEHQLYEKLGISPALAELVRASWDRDDPSLYGRMDLRFEGKSQAKLLEYNADTPTALFEAAVVQWHWLQEVFPDDDQYNSIHEGLIAAWTRRRQGRDATVHLACMPDDDDDLLTTAYLQDTAVQAGYSAALIALPDVGWDGRRFVDLANQPIDLLFKLYPWEWLIAEQFAPHIAASGTAMIEPAWRIVPASKGILAVLWELFPGHPNLLPAGIDPARVPTPHITKPFFGREGANIGWSGPDGLIETDGPFAANARVVQQFEALASFDGWYPVVGAWVIDGDAHGIGIREDRSLITGRSARFVPHLIRRSK